MTLIDRIKSKLDVLKPHYCEIIDESHKHVNHTNGSTGNHVIIKISSDILTNQTLLAGHKIIHQLLADELSSGLHALSINIKR